MFLDIGIKHFLIKIRSHSDVNQLKYNKAQCNIPLDYWYIFIVESLVFTFLLHYAVFKNAKDLKTLGFFSEEQDSQVFV